MLESICPTYLHNTGNPLVHNHENVRHTYALVFLARHHHHHHHRRHYLLPLLQSPSLPKGSLARSNASEGYPFEKVKSPRRGLPCFYAVDSFIVPMLHFFTSFPPLFHVYRFRFDHGSEKKKIGERGKVGGAGRGGGGMEKDSKNIESHHILLSPLKRYRSRALMDSLMERLSLEVP